MDGGYLTTYRLDYIAQALLNQYDGGCECKTERTAVLDSIAEAEPHVAGTCPYLPSTPLQTASRHLTFHVPWLGQMASLVVRRATCSRPLASTLLSLGAPAYARAPFGSLVKPSTQPRTTHRTTCPSFVATIQPQRTALNISSVRNASSAPAPSGPYKTPPQDIQQPPQDSQPPPPDVLTWDRFFDLRRRRRYINLVASIITAGGAVGIAGPLIAQQDIDSWGAQISGLDPVIVLGIATIAVAGGGWLCGPTLGGTLFGLWAGRRGWNQMIAEVSDTHQLHAKMVYADSVVEGEVLLWPCQAISRRSCFVEPAESNPRLLW